MTATLLLNASYEPLKLIPITRAIVMVLAEKAEVVHAGDDVYRSVSTSIPVPRVIRLVRYVRVPYRGTLPLTRANVLARDNNECQYCGKEATTIDHVQPRSRFPNAHRWENVVAACAPCNTKKDDRTLKELRWPPLKREPVAPKGTRWFLVGIAKVEECWLPYLEGVA